MMLSNSPGSDLRVLASNEKSVKIGMPFRSNVDGKNSTDATYAMYASVPMFMLVTMLGDAVLKAVAKFADIESIVLMRGDVSVEKISALSKFSMPYGLASVHQTSNKIQIDIVTFTIVTNRIKTTKHPQDLSVYCFLVNVARGAEEIQKREKEDLRQLEYISLIKTLLKQTNLLSSFDGFLLATSTILASMVVRFKPLLIASAMSYLLYAGTALLLPGPMARYGLPTMSETAEPKLAARSDEAGSSSNKIFDNVMAETLMRSIQFSPVMTVLTNVSVNVIADTMSRLRFMSRMLVTQIGILQGNMSLLSRMLSNECMSRFLCRVGQFTDVNFPMVSSSLRSLA
ncbi:uncharacterized protein LOC129224278 [Uloborus diversus]|uniref:uncharacterized protein LOC129224278 n=1 Tax=Uloborus diversus TaxID=327109 RepID=UPI0024093777|nr:uncharacterized protein LOC129224278 [Uloborus diversus]